MAEMVLEVAARRDLVGDPGSKLGVVLRELRTSDMGGEGARGRCAGGIYAELALICQKSNLQVNEIAYFEAPSPSPSPSPTNSLLAGLLPTPSSSSLNSDSRC